MNVTNNIYNCFNYYHKWLIFWTSRSIYSNLNRIWVNFNSFVQYSSDWHEIGNKETKLFLFSRQTTVVYRCFVFKLYKIEALQTLPPYKRQSMNISRCLVQRYFVVNIGCLNIGWTEGAWPACADWLEISRVRSATASKLQIIVSQYHSRKLKQKVTTPTLSSSALMNHITATHKNVTETKVAVLSKFTSSRKEESIIN